MSTEQDEEPTPFARSLIERLRTRDGRIDARLVEGGVVEAELPDGRRVFADLENAWRAVQLRTERGPISLTAALDHEIEQLLAMPHAFPEGEELLSCLRMVVRPEDALEALVTNRRQVAVTRVTPDLVGLVVADTERHLSYLSTDQLETTGRDALDAARIALKQTVEEVQPEIRVLGDRPPFGLACGGNYELTLMLVDSLWTWLAERVAGHVVVAAPARDLLFVAGTRDAFALDGMRDIVKDAFARPLPYLGSPQLFRRHEGTWVVHDD